MHDKNLPSYETADHYAHFMPQAGRRGLSAMDTWFASDQPRKVPEKSLAAPWVKKLTQKPQVVGMIKSAGNMKVK
jgi:hypothetical protein